MEETTVSKVNLCLLYCHLPTEASHTGLMRQFELYAINTGGQPLALMSVAACQASGRLCLFT